MGDMMKRVAENIEERNRWIAKNCKDLGNLCPSERQAIKELRWKAKEEEEDRQRRRESAELANKMIREELEAERQKQKQIAYMEAENRFLREILAKYLQQ